MLPVPPTQENSGFWFCCTVGIGLVPGPCGRRLLPKSMDSTPKSLLQTSSWTANFSPKPSSVPGYPSLLLHLLPWLPARPPLDTSAILPARICLARPSVGLGDNSAGGRVSRNIDEAGRFVPGHRAGGYWFVPAGDWAKRPQLQNSPHKTIT
jgi:hypothetical protein